MGSLIAALGAFLWGILAPDRLLLIGLTVGCALLYSRHRRIGRRLLVGTCTGLILVACLPIEDWVMLPLESRFPARPAVPDSIDGIIVLSGAGNRDVTVWRDQATLSDNAERLVSFVALAHRHPEARLVVSDGPSLGTGEGTLGATTAKKLFEELGLPIERVEFEEQAHNTYENGVFSRSLVEPKDTETWVLVTSAFHVPRAVGVWRELGWEVIPYPVDYRVRPGLLSLGLDPAGSLQALSMGVKEWGALLLYRFIGRTASLFPKPRM